jgi:hypothetical protein
MKLQQIQIQKSTSQRQVQNIKRVVTLKTVGYINILGRNKVQTDTRRTKVAIEQDDKMTVYKKVYMPKLYKTKTNAEKGLKTFFEKVVDASKKLYSGVGRAFNTAFAQASIFEAKITQAKKALKDAKRQMLTTLEWFNLHVAMCKACLHLRSFKLSLPRQIVNLLF